MIFNNCVIADKYRNSFLFEKDTKSTIFDWSNIIFFDVFARLAKGAGINKIKTGRSSLYE